MTATTRKIAGHAFTLTVGRCYLATRPMASRWDERFDVTITDKTDGEVAAVVADLTYEKANALLNAFNGEMSFAGREWS